MKQELMKLFDCVKSGEMNRERYSGEIDRILSLSLTAKDGLLEVFDQRIKLLDRAYDNASEKNIYLNILNEVKYLKGEYEKLQFQTKNGIRLKSWINTDMPKDGTKIIRWNKAWKIPQCVFYKEGVSESKECVWVTGDMSNSYPEESFLPNIWQLVPTSPEL